MRRQTSRLILVAVCLVGTAFGLAQEGHPLTGTWTGDWGAASQPRKHMTIVMNWDGKKVDAILNPGPDAVPVNVALNLDNWTVRLEADAKDAANRVTHIAADGRIDDLGSYHRKITGVWTEGSVRGDFKLTRD